MIFKVEHGKQIRSSNDNIDAVKEFVDCNDKVLKYVFLMYDYDSPYARLPFELRKEQVVINLDYTNDAAIRKFFSRHKESIGLATKTFCDIQYNAEMESLISCKMQMRQWDELLRKDDKTDKEQAMAFKVFEKMPAYMDRVREMEEIVGYRDKYDKEEEGTPKTALERYIEMKNNGNEFSSR